MRLLPILLAFVVSIARAAVQVNAGAGVDNGLSTGAGAELAIGSIVRVGHFDIGDADIAAHINDPAYLAAHFTTFGIAKIGDAFNVPGHFASQLSNANSDSLGLAGKQIAFWVLRATDNSTATATATEHGVFYSIAASWHFPANNDIPNTTSIDLTDLTNAAGTALAGTAFIPIGAFPSGTSGSTGSPNFGLAPIVRSNPSCKTKPATEVTATTATLHAKVDANGRATTVTFSAGSTVFGSVSAGSARGSVNVELPIGNLTPETTYNIQAKATNNAGSAKGGTVTFFTSNAPRTAGVTFDTLARSGGEVPGFATDTFASFGTPSIQGPGFLAKVNTPGGTYRAIFSGDPSLRRVKTGDTPTDLPSVEFASIDDPVFADATHYAFHARLTPASATTDRAIFSNAFGPLRLLARANGPVTDIPGAKFESFTSLAMPNADGAIFLAKLKQGPGGVDKTNNIGLFVERTGGAVLLLRKGDAPIVRGTARTIQSLRFLGITPGTPGHARYDTGTGILLGAITFADTTEAAVALETTGTPTYLAVTDDTTSSGLTLLTFGQPDAVLGTPFFLSDTQQQGIAIVSPEGTLVAKVGGPAPGASGALFKSFKDPIGTLVGGNDRIAFQGKLAPGSGINDTNDQGIWQQTDFLTPDLTLIAREKSPAPESGGAKFARLQSLAYVPERGPLFLGTLLIGTGKATAASAAGLWGTDSTHTLRCLLRANDQLTVAAIPRTVSTISVLGAVPGSPGQGRAVTAGKVLAKIGFADASTALIEITIP